VAVAGGRHASLWRRAHPLPCGRRVKSVGGLLMDLLVVFASAGNGAVCMLVNTKEKVTE